MRARGMAAYANSGARILGDVLQVIAALIEAGTRSGPPDLYVLRPQEYPDLLGGAA